MIRKVCWDDVKMTWDVKEKKGPVGQTVKYSRIGQHGIGFQCLLAWVLAISMLLQNQN